MLKYISIQSWKKDTHHISSIYDRWNDFCTGTEFESKWFFHKNFFFFSQKHAKSNVSWFQMHLRSKDASLRIFPGMHNALDFCFLESKFLCDSLAFVIPLHKIWKLLRLKLHKNTLKTLFLVINTSLRFFNRTNIKDQLPRIFPGMWSILKSFFLQMEFLNNQLASLFSLHKICHFQHFERKNQRPQTLMAEIWASDKFNARISFGEVKHIRSLFRTHFSVLHEINRLDLQKACP